MIIIVCLITVVVILMLLHFLTHTRVNREIREAHNLSIVLIVTLIRVCLMGARARIHSLH